MKNLMSLGTNNLRKTMKSKKPESSTIKSIKPLDAAPAEVTEDKAPVAPTEDKAPVAPTEDKAPVAVTEDKAPEAPTEDKAPETVTEDKAPETVTEDKADTSNGAVPAEKKKPIDKNIAVDVSEIVSDLEQVEIREAAKHPTSFISRITKNLPSISSITKIIPLPPIPVVVMAKAAQMVPILMTVVDKISDPDTINLLATYVKKRQEVAIAEQEHKLKKLQEGGGIQFFTPEECSFF